MILDAAGYRPPTSIGRPTKELFLHESILRSAATVLPRVQHARVAVHEFTIRGARPDVAIVDADLGSLAERAAAQLEPLAATADLAVRATFRTGHELSAVQATDLASRYVSPAKARAALRRLYSRGYIGDGANGLRLAPSAQPAVARAVGVEAKLGDWQAASRQARRWRLTFDAALLAFPALYGQRLDPSLPGLALFGVVAVTTEGRIDILVQPPTRRADAFNLTLVEEAFYMRALSELDLTQSRNVADYGELGLAYS